MDKKDILHELTQIATIKNCQIKSVKTWMEREERLYKRLSDLIDLLGSSIDFKKEKENVG